MRMSVQFRQQNRLAQYDYSQYGRYFLTVCTKGMREWYGEVRDGKIVVNECGRVAQGCWEEIPRHYDGVELYEFVVTPNHVYGILIINNDYGRHVGDAYMRLESRVAQARPMAVVADLRPLPREREDRSKMSLSRAIHGFNSSVTRKIHKLDHQHFEWQRSFRDHIIRNDESLEKIRLYIHHNPLNWELGEE